MYKGLLNIIHSYLVYKDVLKFLNAKGYKLNLVRETGRE